MLNFMIGCFLIAAKEVEIPREELLPVFGFSLLITVIAAVPYYRYLHRNKPGKRTARLYEQAKQHGYCVEATLVKSRSAYTRPDEPGGPERSDYVVYSYTVDGREYRKTLVFSAYNTSAPLHLTFYYDPQNPKRAYTKGRIEAIRRGGCLRNIQIILPFLLPFLLSAVYFAYIK